MQRMKCAASVYDHTRSHHWYQLVLLKCVYYDTKSPILSSAFTRLHLKLTKDRHQLLVRIMIFGNNSNETHFAHPQNVKITLKRVDWILRLLHYVVCVSVAEQFPHSLHIQDIQNDCLQSTTMNKPIFPRFLSYCDFLCSLLRRKHATTTYQLQRFFFCAASVKGKAGLHWTTLLASRS